MNYYHIQIKIDEASYFGLNKTDLHKIEDDIVIPYLKRKRFLFNGNLLKWSKSATTKIIIKKSDITFEEYLRNQNEYFISQNIFLLLEKEDIFTDDKYMQNMTEQVLKISKCSLVRKLKRMLKTTKL